MRAWPFGPDGGRPGLGHYLTTSLDFGSRRGVFLLISHCTVRNQIWEAAGSHSRTHLLTGEDERIYLAAQGILFSLLFPPTRACCRFHLAWWVAVLSETGIFNCPSSPLMDCFSTTDVFIQVPPFQKQQQQQISSKPSSGQSSET